ncbi:hypothetical protein H5S40_04270 [Limosilactobacillus sp. RRLNB_1_1]|uniref:Exonuclease domain-containing protein n=1 Tax=Limosilactobacillus albertensis TaxID=2759752 RepID=A0A7W3Y874_9LACO|nr:hypothetical protein [Limosilactobacillus albertensis]MBB1069371.1 hypothetical protein [Limosilactobacillus albertensis]MCD7118597.1 3'-5' exonuclease [Limosilactobacillus albertensis]MCD7128358.1 3'-5' exonuclease [Limosilactobacillus albertensis]
MNDKKELVYWIDLTDQTDFDEIIRLTIIDTDNNVLFDHEFGTDLVGYWESRLNGINPDDVVTKPLFKEYKDEIQAIFNQASKVITFYGHVNRLQFQGINVLQAPYDDLSDDFRVIADGPEDTLEHMCDYYGYPLPNNIMERTGIDNAKAVNYCYQAMEHYRQANNG